jgi:heterodisulfide reductase subunit A
LTLSEVKSVSGEIGNFEVQLVQHPRYVDPAKCIACGLCAEKCPTKVDNEYDAGLGKRKSIHVKYAQAVPLKYAIDSQHCIYLTKGKCKVCEKLCAAKAINFEDKEREITIRAGAVIIAPGCEIFNPEAYNIYGYRQSPNIVTSLEFERMLSASGPFGGHLIRPSDKKEPRKIAWIQCVGSRDVHEGARGYCSAVCCTYAIKEALVAKEHSKEPLDSAIFYIDMRTYGKDFERYYNRAREEAGVRFIRSRITQILPVRNSGDLLIRYTDEAGRRVEEVFDLVVLSVGFAVQKEAVDLANRLEIRLDSFSFASTSSFEPVQTSRPGIFVCGAFQGPKDIPTSVIESSASAAMAESVLAQNRWSMTKTKTIPGETDVRGQSPRVGVFVCRCGTNIAGVLDVPAIAEYARGLPGVVYVEENLFSCSQDTQQKMAQVIKEQSLNRVVVAACSPLTHEVLFQETVTNAGINKYLFEMANIRNQCSWVHGGEKEAGTGKAKDLVRMAVAKVRLFESMAEPIIKIDPAALVIGGGLSGMTAAKNLAEQGYRTYLVEKGDTLGGQARSIYRTWKGEDVQEHLGRLIREVKSNERIEVLLKSQLKGVEGFVGNFRSTIQANGTEKVLDHGIAVIATGAAELKPDQYLYGQDPRVVTSLELDRRLIDQDPSLRKVRSAAFVQCVGSRIKERPYCSKVCCTHSVMNGLKLKEIDPEMDVFILYRDMRTYGLREELYREARSKGILFIRYDDLKGIKATIELGELQVRFTSAVLNREAEIRPDLLVLATAVVSPKENPVAKLFKVPVNGDGFFVEAHVKLRPIDFATDGVFVCGLAHSPKPIDESIAHGLGAAARAVTLLSQKEMSGNAIVARIDPETCVGCQGCLSVCPYEAVRFLEDRKICEINEAICKGCGACAATCPSASAQLKRFTSRQIYAQIEKAVTV